MKSLFVLLLVQTTIMFLLFGKLVANEEQTVRVARFEQQKAVTGTSHVKPADHCVAGDSRNLDETQLRRIVREELEAHWTTFSVMPTQVLSAAMPEAIDEAENRYQMDFVAEKVGYFQSVGDISDVEMQGLLTEIAKLDKAGQQEMLGRLVRALNAGEIRGLL
jgi:hypothetical protein